MLACAQACSERLSWVYRTTTLTSYRPFIWSYRCGGFVCVFVCRWFPNEYSCAVCIFHWHCFVDCLTTVGGNLANDMLRLLCGGRCAWCCTTDRTCVSAQRRISTINMHTWVTDVSGLYVCVWVFLCVFVCSTECSSWERIERELMWLVRSGCVWYVYHSRPIIQMVNTMICIGIGSLRMDGITPEISMGFWINCNPDQSRFNNGWTNRGWYFSWCENMSTS